MNRINIIFGAIDLVSKLPVEKLLMGRSDSAIDRLEQRLRDKGLLDPPVTSLPIMPVMAPIPQVYEDSWASSRAFPEVGVDEDSESAYSGTSQISSEGKACIPCGSDHLTTVSGLLSESLRFAREGGIEHPEVIERISDAEEELNVFERKDGDASTVMGLPPHERLILEDMLKTSRAVRHQLKEIVDYDSLLASAAFVQTKRREHRQKIFQLALGNMPSESRELIAQRAEEMAQTLRSVVGFDND
jgi:hypothetical protein